jgi:hypothetical protein
MKCLHFSSLFEGKPHLDWDPQRWTGTKTDARTADIYTHLGHDESLLEIGVDPAGCLGRLRPLEYGPGLHLIRPSREEVLQLQRLVPLHRMEQRELGYVDLPCQEVAGIC